MEDWEKESKLQKARGDFFMENLKDIMYYYKDRGQCTVECWMEGPRGSPAIASKKKIGE